MVDNGEINYRLKDALRKEGPKKGTKKCVERIETVLCKRTTYITEKLLELLEALQLVLRRRTTEKK